MIRAFTVAILAAMALSSVGCNIMPAGKDAFRKTTRMFTPRTSDYDDGSDDSGKEWDFVGNEGRAEQVREQDPDPWFKDIFMSEKANSIERNLGID